ncbi:hypothetical protein [Brachyspira hyodysenteriae]|uniref:Lipoprotein n=3 Tax=Brachyspira hyodysenteriae TaxID=159 RepID=A0A3B6V887_BRAHW|nr:hypothetical protein [Brachyspira hyodysenteriae]ACN82812.1 hypothetical protein BHWA1_00312 [Brachyspira hyodysenteriae WA1]ANN62565.1 hypothetical protein BHYOB78_01425 [Brachyspira hyodysenteriae ATCC 27164]KLI15410.1 hypothetical protein SU44_08790 [Brachyspira hyodysenteriae]KLI20858.1 hypothetical protein SU43_11360 [Brachyspira hyodysenteriae]KLI21773.1 hypothetical protein SR30_11715 [Brachyspira hyodysenteriae]
MITKHLITILFIILFSISCSNNSNNTDKKKANTSESVLDYVQVDSPNSFAPLGIGITVAPPEHGQNGKYFIVNKNIAESTFDYMNNAYVYRASKDKEALLSLYGDYQNNTNKNFTENEYKIDVEYNVTSLNEKFTLWKVDDIYYTLSAKIEDDKDLTNLSVLYVNSIHWHKK